MHVPDRSRAIYFVVLLVVIGLVKDLKIIETKVLTVSVMQLQRNAISLY